MVLCFVSGDISCSDACEVANFWLLIVTFTLFYMSFISFCRNVVLSIPASINCDRKTVVDTKVNMRVSSTLMIGDTRALEAHVRRKSPPVQFDSLCLDI